MLTCLQSVNRNLHTPDQLDVRKESIMHKSLSTSVSPFIPHLFATQPLHCHQTTALLNQSPSSLRIPHCYSGFRSVFDCYVLLFYCVILWNSFRFLLERVLLSACEDILEGIVCNHLGLILGLQISVNVRVV